MRSAWFRSALPTTTSRSASNSWSARSLTILPVGTRLEPNLELVSTLSPDLIIADDLRHSAIYPQLSQLAPTIILNSWEGDYQTIKDSVVTIADALGDKAKGEKVIAEHDARIKALISKIPAGEKRRFMLAVANPDSMALHSSSSFTGSVFKAMGLTPAIDSKDAVESGAGLERLVAVNPDVFLVATDSPGTVFEQWKGNAAWQNISAVQERHGLRGRSQPVLALPWPENGGTDGQGNPCQGLQGRVSRGH